MASMHAVSSAYLHNLTMCTACSFTIEGVRVVTSCVLHTLHFSRNSSQCTIPCASSMHGLSSSSKERRKPGLAFQEQQLQLYDGSIASLCVQLKSHKGRKVGGKVPKNITGQNLATSAVIGTAPQRHQKSTSRITSDSRKGINQGKPEENFPFPSTFSNSGGTVACPPKKHRIAGTCCDRAHHPLLPLSQRAPRAHAWFAGSLPHSPPTTKCTPLSMRCVLFQALASDLRAVRSFAYLHSIDVSGCQMATGFATHLALSFPAGCKTNLIQVQPETLYSLHRLARSGGSQYWACKCSTTLECCYGTGCLYGNVY